PARSGGRPARRAPGRTHPGPGPGGGAAGGVRGLRPRRPGDALPLAGPVCPPRHRVCPDASPAHAPGLRADAPPEELAMTTTTDLTPLLKRLKLGTLLPTLPERIALARREQLDYAAFLEVLLADEVSRRDHSRLQRQVLLAGFEEVCRLEDFDWT